MKKLSLALTVLTILLLGTSPSRADVSPDDVAPKLSFCIGESSTCVMPDFNLTTVNYDLVAKKWQSGVSSIGVGYMLLFVSDQPYASGLAVHISGQWNQDAKDSPSFLALTPTLVIAKYFEVGMTIKLMDGEVGKYVTFGFGANADVLQSLVTGKNLRDRLMTARAARAEQPVGTSP